MREVPGGMPMTADTFPAQLLDAFLQIVPLLASDIAGEIVALVLELIEHGFDDGFALGAARVPNFEAQRRETADPFVIGKAGALAEDAIGLPTSAFEEKPGIGEAELIEDIAKEAPDVV